MENALEPVVELEDEESLAAAPDGALAEALPTIDAPLAESESAEEPHEPAPPSPLSVPLPRSLTYTGSPTFREFLQECGDEAALVRLRMAEVRLPPQDQLFFAEYSEPLNLMAVVSVGLPETAALLPLWVRIAAACPRADLRVITEDDLARLELLLHDEGQQDAEAVELPMLYIFDEEYLLQGQWGPRPQAAETWLDGWIAQHPDLESLADSEDPQAQQRVTALSNELALQMRIWYRGGLDAEASAEIRTLLASLREEPAESP